MDDQNVRTAVRLHLAGKLTEAEAARQAGIPQSKLRYYTRTSGLGAPSPIEPSDEPEKTV